jgi:hypothetical protein
VFDKVILDKETELFEVMKIYDSVVEQDPSKLTTDQYCWDDVSKFLVSYSLKAKFYMVLLNLRKRMN